MCQSVVTLYLFCGCHAGAAYEQRCSEPSSNCEYLLAKPTPLKLQCYCPEHSSQTFKSVREEKRDTKRVETEYRKILLRETQQTLLRKASGRRHRTDQGVKVASYQISLGYKSSNAKECKNRQNSKTGIGRFFKESHDMCRIM